MVKARKGKARKRHYTLPKGFVLTNEERSWFTDDVIKRYYELSNYPTITPSYRFSDRGWAMYNATNQPVSVFLKFVYAKLGATRATEKNFPRWFNTSKKKPRPMHHAARRKQCKLNKEDFNMSEATVNKSAKETETELMQRLLERLTVNVDDSALRAQLMEKVDAKKLNDLVEAATHAENAKTAYLNKSSKQGRWLVGASVVSSCVIIGLAGMVAYDRFARKEEEMENTGDE